MAKRDNIVNFKIFILKQWFKLRSAKKKWEMQFFHSHLNQRMTHK